MADQPDPNANNGNTPQPPTPDAPTPVPSTPNPGRPPLPPRRGPRAGVPPTPASPAGSVVPATPAPMTPSTSRRELGASPIRLTPRPSTPVSAPTTPASPADGGAAADMTVWGTNINITDAEQRFEAFLTSFRAGGGGNAAKKDEEEQGDQEDEQADQAKPYYMDLLEMLYETGGTILNIDLTHLHAHDPGMYRQLASYPNELITVLDAVAEKIFATTYPDEGIAITEKRRKGIQTRTFNILASQVQSMRELNPKHISTLVAIRGMVIRASNVIPDIQRAMYKCTKCSAMVDVMISFGRIDEPRRCNACGTRDSFTLIHSRSSFSDKQMVRLQEAPESIPKGDTPATFTLVMYDALVDSVKPGDRVEVTGILRATPVRVNPKLRVVRSVFRTYIDCVHVRVMNNNQARVANISKPDEVKEGDNNATERQDDRVFDAMTEDQKQARKQYFETLACHPKIYERLANSLAPSIFGMMDEKKGVLLQLFGGTNKQHIGRDGVEEDAQTSGEAVVAPTTQTTSESESAGGGDSARFRSAINVLLIGDPGTSKSQLLHSAHRLAPRGVYTSGRGSSAVGLTAYVTKDPESDDFVLESGALVLSDRGVCCIDEFDKMSDYARSVLHEAMEQQTVSIAKAGIIATLNARTAILAAANPINSRYDPSKSVVENIDLPPTLLSRFDLIYLVLDAPNAEADRKLAQHIVSLFYHNYDEDDKKNKQDGGDNNNNNSSSASASASASDNHYSNFIDAKTLTEYLAYCRECVQPVLSDEASEALVQGYLDMRSGGRGGGNITATPRQLESLIRLAEAHARMRLKEMVEEDDVHEAMRLVKSAMHMAAYDPLTGKIDMNLFAAGKSRAADSNVEALCQAVVDKLKAHDGGTGQLAVSRLLSAIRETSDVDVSAGDLRGALRRLEETERIAIKSGGNMVTLV